MTRPCLTRVVWARLSAGQQAAVLQRPATHDSKAIAESVASLIEQVRMEGDPAIRRLAREFDHVDVEHLRVTPDEVESARESLDPAARAAIDVAIANVSRFHAAQVAAPLRVETAPGVVCERVSRPIRAVGLYVPAGTAPLPSTAIMLAVPAQIAGCAVRVVCTPPRRDGCADPAVVAAAMACGVTDIFKIGGAQAIAAMAFGTQSVPKVDKIFGPGNIWVTAAKQAVSQDPAGAAFDMPAGPSEVMVIAAEGANPCFVALDLLSQAEHGPDSQVILVTTHEPLLDEVQQQFDALLPQLSRRGIIERSLTHGAAIVAEDLPQAFDIANRYAPEHLILQVPEPRRWIDRVQQAGSVFLGPWTPESVGDYCSGTNHVLPTYGHARAYSGLSVGDFQRRMTLQELTREGLLSLAPTVMALAHLEGLDAHGEAVRSRVMAVRP
ncbi:MAG: histidinol dehydrogenase [Nevskiales bacterium]